MTHNRYHVDDIMILTNKFLFSLLINIFSDER